MINNLYNLGLNALNNAQVSIANASNNIANADTAGYQRTSVTYETGDSITLYGLTVGTGAEITSIQSQLDKYVEAQYLDASADLTRYNSSLTYLSQLDSLLDQTDGGLNDTLSEFWDSWNELVTDPDSLSAREALLGDTESLIYGITSTQEELQNAVDSINTEIQSEVDAANQLIDDIAAANEAIAANPDDNQLISDRTQMIRDLNDILGVDTIEQSNGQVTVLTEEGYNLVDGTETHYLTYGSERTTESLMDTSTYDGEIQYSGDSSEEILLEFVSSGTDGTAQFKVSLDGGSTWVEDENGDTMLYTADDESGSVEIEGVEIWFDGSGDHEVGDRYSVVAKTGLYYEKADGTEVNITPLTDESGDDVSGRVASGTLAGLYTTRDDAVSETMDALDDFAEAIIWEVNSAHATGAGLEGHTGLTGSYAVEDSSALLSNSGLDFADRIESGDLELITYDSDGEVSTSAIISYDASTDSLDDIIADINTAFGGELTASVDADGFIQLSSDTDMTFEIAGDSTNLMAALGVNTYFTGTDASTISLDSYVADDPSHINAGVVSSDGSVVSGDNTVASAIYSLSTEAVTVGDQQTTIAGYLSGIVSSVGSAASSAELKATYASTSAEYLYEQQASASEVSVDEELIDLTKYQQAYQAAAEIITVTRTMMETVLDMV